MNAIIGHAHPRQEKMDGPLNRRQVNPVHHVTGAVDRLPGLIDDVLVVSRRESGMPQLSRDDIDLPRLMQWVRNDMAPLALVSQLDIVIEQPDGKKLHRLGTNVGFSRCC